MNRKSEAALFFTALGMLGVMIAGGIAYFKTDAQPGTLLADITATTPTSTAQIPPVQPLVNTIPTGTIVAPAPSAKPVPPLPLPYSLTAATANATYWPKAWGDILFPESGGLALSPNLIYHGANSFLNGASSWNNYAVSANVSWLMGGWFDIVARVANNTQNFVYCEFGPNGTEIIERVNGADTQLAATSASTTDAEGAVENFGMNVYGGDISCTMADQEVIGTHVTDNNESPAGGIGFVIFGQPEDQKEVTISDVYVSALQDDSIVVPFPLPAVAPPPAPAPPPPQPTPKPPSPSPVPPPAPATTTKTMPYALNTFAKTQGWNTWWGSFSVATDSLTMGATKTGTGGGVLLAGTGGWQDYLFQATLDWTKGETFGLYARYTNAQNYVLCYFDESDIGDVHISLEQHVNGIEYTLAQGDVTDYNQWGGSDITAYIEVKGSQGACSFNNHFVSSVGEGDELSPPYSGGIGFTTWDPSVNNSQIIVNSIYATTQTQFL